MTKPGHFIVLYNVFEKYQELNLMHVAFFLFVILIEFIDFPII